MDPFALLAYASLAASRTVSQWLLACQNFTLESQDLFCRYKVISMNYGSSTSMENHGDEWGLADTYNEGYIDQLQPESTYKIH